MDHLAVPPQRSEIGDWAGPIPAFDGYPYLAIGVTRQLVHFSILPATLLARDYAMLVRDQVDANKLDACLVLVEDYALYVHADGREYRTATLPSRRLPVMGRLRLSRDFPLTNEMEQRLRRLERYVRQYSPKAGFMVGDLTKGGRPATPEEFRSLQGPARDGVPRGLNRCEVCGDWRGECLDPKPRWAGLVMKVACLCENDNRCARCLEPLAERKLNANYYDPRDGAIWHVPAFCGLGHEC
jgi:hypothetical protein